MFFRLMYHKGILCLADIVNERKNRLMTIDEVNKVNVFQCEYNSVISAVPKPGKKVKR